MPPSPLTGAPGAPDAAGSPDAAARAEARRGRAGELVALLSRFVGLQLVVQVCAGVAGFIVVRTLPKHAYAAFTLAAAAQATFGLLADSGSGIAMSVIAQRTWNDREAFGRLLATVLRLRRVTCVPVLAVGLPLLVAGLMREQLPWPRAVALAGLVGWSFYEQLTAIVSLFALRIHLRVNESQRLDVLVGAMRVMGAATSFLLPFPEVMIVAVALASRSQTFFSRRLVATLAAPGAEPSPEMRREVLQTMRSQVLPTVFHCLQGQLTVWLIALRGHGSSLADVGALSRFAFFFTIPTAALAALLTPRITRETSPVRLRRFFLVGMTGYGALCAVMLTFAIVLPELYLLLLGPKYAGLRVEVAWQIASQSAGALVGALWSMNAARGWVGLAWMVVPSTLATQALALTYLDVGEPRGAIQLSLTSHAPYALIIGFMTLQGFAKLRRSAAPPPTSAAPDAR